LRQRLEGIAGSMAQFQAAGDSQGQTIAEMRQILASLTSTPELAAS